jgi:16S rRNA (uracil1498-N3)-methyltransferase
VMRRFYAPPESFVDGTVTLDSDETRHLRDVLRLHEADDIAVFDGAGNEFSARLQSISKTGAVANILEQLKPSAPESPILVTLASVAIPGDKYDLIIQKAVELGVSNFVPLSAIRSEVKIKDLPKKLTRWRRIALDATKQCGRATLMTIHEPREVTELLQEAPGGSELLFFSERDGSRLPDLQHPKSITVVIGPKGGWDGTEIQTAKQNNFSVVTLGGRIMRAETAAIALTAILQHRYGDIN